MALRRIGEVGVYITLVFIASFLLIELWVLNKKDLIQLEYMCKHDLMQREMRLGALIYDGFEEEEGEPK